MEKLFWEADSIIVSYLIITHMS